MSDNTLSQNHMKTSSLIPLLQNLEKSPAEDVCKINEPLYIYSCLEDPFLYHTTPFANLKKILRDGFLTGSPAYLTKYNINPLHPNLVCFTTNKWRHLSNMPDAVQWLGITHDCYLKIPFENLKTLVKPVIYTLDEHEIEQIILSDQYYYLTTLSCNLEALAKRLNLTQKELPNYLYNTWWIENEWRAQVERFKLPKNTVVYVSNPQQKIAVQKLTSLPVEVDVELYQLKREMEFPDRMIRRIIRIIGTDLYWRGTRFISISRQPVTRPDSTVATVHARICDVPFLHAITITRRLKNAGLKVWVRPKAWRHRSRADVEVDLKPKSKRVRSKLC